MPVQYRIATAADAPVIVALIEAAYRGPGRAGQWDSESHLLKGPRTNPAEVGALIARADSRFVLAEQEGRIIGCALIQQTDAAAADGSPDGVYFGMFAVDPAIRAAGLGKQVLAEAEGRAKATFGATHMVMTVINVREQLIAWYQRRGYRLTGKRVPFPFTETSGETTRDFDLVELRRDFDLA